MGEFDAVTKGTAGCNDGVFEKKGADCDSEVDPVYWTGGPACRGGRPRDAGSLG